MTKSQIQHFQKLLQEKRISIMRDLGQLEERSLNITPVEASAGPIYSDHMSELGSDAIERENAFMFASRDGTYLAQLEEALVRIKDEMFGRCRICEEQIPIQRLEAVPTTTLCVPCKEKNQEKSNGA